MSARNQLPVVVVGAGSAGVVVASRLAADPTISVLLLESNSALGGSSLRNYMVGMTGMHDDYEWERDFGCAGWTWETARTTFGAMPDMLHEVQPGEAGQVDRALVEAAANAGVPRIDQLAHDAHSSQGAGFCSLTMSNGVRHSVLETYFAPLTNQMNLAVRVNAVVDSVVIDDSRAVGVRLAGGELIEARGVVACAGALASPVLLRRSGIDRPGIGVGLQDHPSIAITLALRQQQQSAIQIGANVRTNSRKGNADIHVLSLNATEESGMFGALIAGVMQVHSRGEVKYDSITGTGIAMFNSLGDERDRVAMRDAVRFAYLLASSQSMGDIAGSMLSDAHGTSAKWISDASDAEIDNWALQQVGAYSHAASSCAMGNNHDDMAVVNDRAEVIGHQNLWLCDASIFPILPRANTHLPVVMVANRVSEMLRETLSESR
jgi:choline dehydrogenase/5-(hydroxymethyl)furfural/furfural oxidase